MEAGDIAGWGLEWGGMAIARADWRFLEGVIESFGVSSVLEFGSGLSTLLFAAGGLHVVSLEADADWAEHVRRLAKPYANAQVVTWDGRAPSRRLAPSDLAFVDGPKYGHSREAATRIAAELCPLVAVHDAFRPGERNWQRKFLAGGGFKLVARGGATASGANQQRFGAAPYCHLWARPGRRASMRRGAATKAVARRR